MGKHHKQVSAFNLEGRFLGFELEDGYKIKRLRLATAEGEICIKLSKESRASVRGVLTPGDWLIVMGEKTINDETEVKYKAYAIRQDVPAHSFDSGTSSEIPARPAPRSPAKPQAILVCQKSDCMKRGGKAMCQALQETLRDRQLDGQVAIKGTGCMKQCKTGPNLVMPDKTRYSRIAARDIPDLIDQHFPAQKREPISI